MRGWFCAVGLFVIGAIAVCSTFPLLMGDAARGQALFGSQGCITCHRLNGDGGQTAPDLGARGGRGFSPAEMAAFMWDHAPRMWTAMARPKVARPSLSEQQAADLFAYFYVARYFDLPRDAGRGRDVFTARRCAGCHAGPGAGPGGARPAKAWQAQGDPIALACELWSHSARMHFCMAQKGIPYPQLTSQDLTDLVTYLEKPSPAKRGLPQPVTASSERGGKLFREKGCEACHAGAADFRTRRTRFSLTDFAASLWNHVPEMPPERARLSYDEMRDTAAYLGALQFFEERGNTDRGRRVFAAKKCVACHGAPGSGAPDLSGKAGSITSYGMVQALWLHGPAMQDEMRRRKLSWPRFTATEMADLVACLHGPALKRR
jgi:mono/diheme cytochrome c family protein